ncbi:MAG: IS1182 family transposase [Saprospiraceae bacterium]|nr:IS1182 family transposase [Saprospiraceae bacterium]HRJ13580.1 IS1182 family transposase [Saprospiraceae bacterium]
MATKVEKVKSIVHKKYDQSQVMLVPVDMKDIIGPDHIVHVIDKIVEGLSLEDLNRYYEGGGGSTYHPKMMIKIWIYAYSERLYTTRRLAKALRENINLMYLSGQQYPCFKTLSNFRSNRMQQMIDIIFKQVLLLLVESGYIDLGDLYVDGTKWEANANRHKRVWGKNTERYKASVMERIENLLAEVKVLQQQEDERHGCSDLKEVGEGREVSVVLNSAQVSAHLVHLQDLIKAESDRAQCDNKRVKDLEQLSSKIEDESEKLLKYEEQERILAGRNSYSKTDEDATMLRMKDDRLLPGYNVQHSTSRQYIVNYSIAQNGSDSPTLIPHLDKMKERFDGLQLPAKIDFTADAGYGSEENYADLEQRAMNAFVKYPLWYQERTGELLKKKYRVENWFFDHVTDTYTCPNNRKLTFTEQRQTTTLNGYERTVRLYTCESCQGCPLAKDCKKSDNARTIQYSPKGEAYKQKAKELLDTEQGKQKRSNRSIEVESPFGDIKYNMQHDRFVLRGLPKVYVEYGLLAIGHNIRKVYCHESGIWQDYYAQRAAKKQQKAKKGA